MKSYVTEYRNSDGSTPTNVLLLRNPLDFLAEDHLRLRTMCSELDRLAKAESAEREVLLAMIEYLQQELPLLLADEDEDLLPRIMKRAEPEDELPKLADRLHEEHVKISGLLAGVASGLEDARQSGTVSADLAADMGALANATRRHLILENAVLMPLSRARLSEEDLRDLRQAMLKRRGLENLFQQ